MKKRSQLAVLGIAMLCTTGFATHPDVTVFVNDEAIVFDVLPIIEDGRVLVPMRGIFESLSCEVLWEDETQKITAHTDNQEEVVLYIGDDQLYVEGEAVYTMPVLPKIVEGRTLVPLRAVGEALGAEVLWDGDTYIVRIESETIPVSSLGELGENTTYTLLNDVLHAKMFEQGETILEIIIDLNNTVGFLPSVKTALLEEAEVVAKIFFDGYRAEAIANYEAYQTSEEEMSEEAFVPTIVKGQFERTFSDGTYASFIFQGEHNEVSSGVTELHAITLDLRTYTKLSAHELFAGVTVADLYAFYKLALENIIAEDQKNVIASNVINRFEIIKTKIGFYIDADENVIFFFPENTIADSGAGIISFALPLVEMQE